MKENEKESEDEKDKMINEKYKKLTKTRGTSCFLNLGI